MDLSIIILNYKTPGLLKYCLKGIARTAPALSYEIIVVDNASHDGSVEMLRQEFPQIRLIESPRNCGFAAGNNLGLTASQGDYVMIMNPDIVVTQGALETMINFLASHKEVGLIGPQLLNPDKSIQYSCARFPTLLTPFYRRTPLGRSARGKKALEYYLMSHTDHLKIQEVDWLLGACLMTRASNLNTVGLLDERFFLYFEDTDLCRRFWEHHLKVVYVATARMFHYHRRISADDSIFKALLKAPIRAHIASSIRYFWKYRRNIVPPSTI